MSSSASDSAQQSPLLTARLSGGDRRSTGAAAEVAREIVADSALPAVLVALMGDADPVVGTRAADALEKASRQRPDLLRPQSDALFHDIGRRDQQELRWHVFGLSAIRSRES